MVDFSEFASIINGEVPNAVLDKPEIVMTCYNLGMSAHLALNTLQRLTAEDVEMDYVTEIYRNANEFYKKYSGSKE